MIYLPTKSLIKSKKKIDFQTDISSQILTAKRISGRQLER